MIAGARRLFSPRCGNQVTACIAQSGVDGTDWILLILLIDRESQQRRVRRAAQLHG